MHASTSIDLASAAALMRSLGMEPSPAQAAFLADDSREVVFARGRGAGKSTAGLVLALHAALAEPARRVLVVAPTVMWARHLRDWAEALVRRGDVRPESRSSWATLVFGNGSTIRAIGATAGPGAFLGVEPTLVVVDQAEKVPAAVMEEIRGRTSLRGRRLALLVDVEEI